MPRNKLENLVHIGQLKHEPPSAPEFAGLIKLAKARLTDAQREALTYESRFDLAYNAAHALALAALRHAGYRSGNRYLVFQLLPETLDIPTATWRLLAKCHERRNLAEYEGTLAIDERLLIDLLAAVQELLLAVQALPHPASDS